MIENENEKIIRIVLEHYPRVQAIYLFGTYGTADEWPNSDADKVREYIHSTPS